jgi:hypothetical protein
LDNFGFPLLRMPYHTQAELRLNTNLTRGETMTEAVDTLYEKTHPYYLKGPGDMLDLSECNYEPIDEPRVHTRFDLSVLRRAASW